MKIMKFRCEIDLSNDAMQRPRDVAQALQNLALKLEAWDALGSIVSTKILDENGNTVGSWSMGWEDSE